MKDNIKIINKIKIKWWDMEENRVGYSKYFDEKIIVGIKDKNQKLRFVNSYMWIFPFFIYLYIFIQICLGDLKYSAINIFLAILFGIATILTFLCFIGQLTVIYFEDDKLILKNKLNKKQEIDIDKYPRISVKDTNEWKYDKLKKKFEFVYASYVYISQGENDIILDTSKIRNKKILKFLNNFEIREKNEISDEKLKLTEDLKEKRILDLIDFLIDKKKIVGVKKKEKMKIAMLPSSVLNFLRLVLVSLTILSIFLTLRQEWKVLTFAMPFLLFMVGVFIEMYDYVYIRISYPYKDCIKINRYVLNYSKNDLMIHLIRIQQFNSYKKLSYLLRLSGNKNKYIIDLQDADLDKIEKFLNNINFE